VPILRYAKLASAVTGADGELSVWDSGTPTGTRNAPLDGSRRYSDLLGWTFDPNAIAGANTVLPTAATIFLMRIPLVRQLSITNVVVAVITKATGTLTDSFVGLWKSDGTLIGQSADQSTSWNNAAGSAGVKTIALASGPFTVTPLAPNDFVWAGIYCGTIGTAGAGLPARGPQQRGINERRMRHCADPSGDHRACGHRHADQHHARKHHPDCYGVLGGGLLAGC
jgi:hypothetical protein